MPSVLMLAAFLLKEEGGGGRGLLELLRYCYTQEESYSG